jgi:hypothetical protein
MSDRRYSLRLGRPVEMIPFCPHEHELKIAFVGFRSQISIRGRNFSDNRIDAGTLRLADRWSRLSLVKEPVTDRVIIPSMIGTYFGTHRRDRFDSFHFDLSKIQGHGIQLSQSWDSGTGASASYPIYGALRYRNRICIRSPESEPIHHMVMKQSIHPHCHPCMGCSRLVQTTHPGDLVARAC